MALSDEVYDYAEDIEDLTGQANDIREEIRNLKNVLINAYWEGRARDAFIDKYNELNRWLSEAENAIAQAAKRIRQYAAELKAREEAEKEED